MSDKIIEGLDNLGKKIEAKAEDTNKKIDEQKSAFDKQISEVKEAFASEKKEFQAKVDQLTEDLTKKGATVEEMVKEVKEMKAKEGRMKIADEASAQTKSIIAEEITKHFDEIKAVSKNRSASFEIKAVGNMTAVNSLTGNIIATYDQTPAVRGRRKVNLRDLVPVINSATGTWKFYRENSPAPADGSLTLQTTHGAAKSQIDYALTEVTVTVDYLAAYLRFAKQMAQDLPFLQTFIANELVEDYKRNESAQFIPTLTSAATAGAGLTGASVVAEKWIDWIGYLKGQDYDPSAIVTDYTNWAAVLKTKPSNYSLPGAVTISADGGVLFSGIPMIAQNNIVAGKTLIGDFSKAAIIQADGLSVQFFEQDSDNVQKNLITARVEARVGFATLRTDAFVYA